MQIITLDKNEFDNFAKNHKYANYMQTSNYGDIMDNDTYHTHYLGFIQNDDLIGVALCLYKDLFWGYRYAYIPRGMLVNYNNEHELKEIINKLRSLLRKQKYIFLKIDPPLILAERKTDGSIIRKNPNAENIMNTLNSNHGKHMGFNLYYETKQPRWNAFIKLSKDTQTLFNSFNKNIQDNIKTASQIGVKVYKDKNFNLEQFYEIIQNSYQKISKAYIKKLYDEFSKTNDVDVYYTELNANTFVQNANKFYENEEHRNRSLGEIISNNNTKYDIKKVINDKMESDKLLHKYKNQVVVATNFLKKYPNGKVLSTAFVIKSKNGADCILISEDKELASYNAKALMIYEMTKIYSNLNLKYLSLGPVTGNFDPRSPYYKNNYDKQGYNTSIVEYIGEYDIVINNLLYKIYQRKLNKKQIKL